MEANEMEAEIETLINTLSEYCRVKYRELNYLEQLFIHGGVSLNASLTSFSGIFSCNPPKIS